MMYMPVIPPLSRNSFDYFDIVVVGWLVFGWFRGRKHGMSQELLPTLQWIGIVVLAGLFYRSFSAFIRQNTGFDLLWANVSAYVLIAIAVHLVFLLIKRATGEKLVGSDLFGRAEYYLGMVAGVVRYACMLIVFCALMNARLITKAELAADEKMQKQNFEDIRFPTFGSVQQEVLFESFTGKVVVTNLNSVMIASVIPMPDKPKGETIAHKREDAVNEVLGASKK